MTTLRTLALAAALIGSIAAPALAEQDRVPEGGTASGRWVQADSRTMLAGSPVSSLEQSGATGGAGQGA